MTQAGSLSERLQGRRALSRGLALFAGAALVLSFAPFRQFWLAPLSLGLLLWLWERTGPREAAALGACFGLGLFSAGTYWLYISLNILGGLWPPLALLLMFALIAAMAAYVAATGWLVVRLAPGPASPLRWLLVFPAAWTLFEWLRGWLFTGFPWLSLGYAQSDTWLAAYAPVVGVYGVSWAVALLGGCLVAALCGAVWQRVTGIAAAALVLAAALLLDRVEWTQPAAGALSVTLVQGSVPQERKWRPEQLQPTLDLYTDLSFTQPRQDLIIWPEAAVPAMPFEIPEFLDALHASLVERDTQLFTGILTYDLDRGEYLNTLLALGEEQGMYHKRHLVAFGEYFPLPRFVRRWMRLMNLPSENISRGSDDQALLTVRSIPVAATICYELAFGAEQQAFLQEAQLLGNVSNDGWFGDSIAPHQHLQIGQLRAREAGRYLLRATNTGVTAIVDHRGRVLDRLPQFSSAALNGSAEPRTGLTPYVRYGNLPVLLPALLILGAAALRVRRG